LDPLGYPYDYGYTQPSYEQEPYFSPMPASMVFGDGHYEHH
jgi:hypothetical protein